MVYRGNGCILVHGGLSVLAEALRHADYKVQQVPADWSDEQVQPYVAQSILTDRPDAFIADAANGQYDVISLDGHQTIDGSPSAIDRTVQKIHRAIQASGIFDRDAYHLLTIHDDGQFDVKELG